MHSEFLFNAILRVEEQMRPNEIMKCADFPCQDVNKKCYMIPNIDVETSTIRTFMISEAPPEDLGDYFYAPKNPFFAQTTVQAFNDAGFDVTCMEDILKVKSLLVLVELRESLGCYWKKRALTGALPQTSEHFADY